jgi:hypothetical protein
VPHAKQVGNGWLVRPAYVDSAARASSGDTGSTSVISSSVQRAANTCRPAYDATTPSPTAAATDIGTSSGGGARSDTVTTGQGRDRSSGQSSPAYAASAPAL